MTPNQLSAISAALQKADYAGAAQHLQQARAALPGDPEVFHWLGVLASLTRQPRDAIAHWQQALALAPAHSAARHNLVQLLMIQNQAAQALQFLGDLQKMTGADEFLLAAQVLAANQQWPAATQQLYRFLALVPSHGPALVLLAQALQAQGQIEAATLPLNHALALQPGSAALHLHLARLLGALRADASAARHCEQALACDPASIEALTGLARHHHREHRLLQALDCGERALALGGTAAAQAPVLNLCGMVHMALGEPEAGLQRLRQATDALPDPAPEAAYIRSNALMALLYADETTTAHDLLGQARRLAHTLPASVAGPLATRLDGRRLRIGYVSPDFRQHAVSQFLMPLLAHHDFSTVEVFCYADVEVPDDVTRAYQALPVQWRATARLSDPALEACIRQDGVDVLVDLAGHTAGNRLAVFARRAALLQASWIGYPGTTGVPAMDAFITDAIASPPGAEAGFSETLLRLDGPLFCYRPPAGGEALPVAPAPVLARGHITFGAYNNLAKANQALLQVWAGVLQAVPGSRLRIKGKAFSDPPACQRFLQRCASAGLDPARLDLAPYQSDPLAHLADFANIDIHLDAYPFGGGVTTCDASWMGVPSVTRHGPRHTACVPRSILTHLGHPEWVAADAPGYLRIAAALAADPQRLADCRRSLRGDMQRSGLRDEPAFARRFEQALRGAWQARAQAAP
jgi:predicted O-linked N-acetylglucosamine transferase (SPINDLY family)